MDTKLILALVAFVFVAVCLLSGKIAASIACGTAVLFLWLTGVLTKEEAFANFVSSNIISMIGMMVVVGAMLKTSILANIASLIKRFEGGGVKILLVASMLIPFILCQFIGGVTALITVLPLLIALADETDVSPTMLVLPASIGAQAGLLALPIGGAATMYLMKNNMMANVGSAEELGFWDLCFTRMPGTIAAILFVLFIGYKLLPQRGLAKSDMLEGSGNVLKKSALPPWKEKATYFIFIATMVMMGISRNIGIETTQVAMTAAILCVLLGILDEKEMFRSINWSLVFMMAFMLAIGTAIGNSGAGDLMAGLLGGVFGSGNETLIIAIVFIFCAILTQFMDNMSLINIFTPIVVIACMQNDISALPLVCAIDASCLTSFSTPLSSPSSLMAYQLGGYSMKEMIKFNLPVVLVVTVVSLVWIPFYFWIR